MLPLKRSQSLTVLACALVVINIVCHALHLPGLLADGHTNKQGWLTDSNANHSPTENNGIPFRIIPWTQNAVDLGEDFVNRRLFAIIRCTYYYAFGSSQRGHSSKLRYHRYSYGTMEQCSIRIIKRRCCVPGMRKPLHLGRPAKNALFPPYVWKMQY